MYSLVIPVYRNEESLPALLEAVTGLAKKLDGLEVVFVVDGSPDRCFELLRDALPKASFRSKLLAHSRNFGSFAAIRTGLAAASGRYFAVMAADLQEPIELVEQFFHVLAKDEADVVVGQRTSRNDPAGSSAASQLFWWLYRKAINPAIPAGGVDVFGCNQLVLKALLALEENNSSLVAQLFWVGFRVKPLPYERLARAAGRSAWTLKKKVRYLLDSVYSFTDLPIRLLTLIGAVAMFLSLVVGTTVFLSWLTGRIAVPGYTPIVLTVVFFGGLNAFGLGIIGDYVWRAYENTKRRPTAIVAAQLDFGQSEGLGSVTELPARKTL
ncbi:MAG: glycosyltransferase family 2 protein [Myxococcaceae bacterium]